MGASYGERKTFIRNLYRDEMRNGFLVTSHRKKLWNVQMNLLTEFVRICRKNKLRPFAIGKTLWGAARFGGFIPWDFEIEVALFRPDYEKFQRLAITEVREPYFVDVWYNYRLESEGATLSDAEGSFQFVTLAQERTNPNRWLTRFPSIRLRDNRTTMLEFPDRNFVNQGIWINILPLDPLPPFVNEEQLYFFETAKFLLVATCAPAEIYESLQSGRRFLRDAELNEFLNCSCRERGMIFEHFMSENFFLSERVGSLSDYCLKGAQHFCQVKDFADVAYLPFETIELPAPFGYESVLTDWSEPILTEVPYPLHSADIPWQEYFNLS